VIAALRRLRRHTPPPAPGRTEGDTNPPAFFQAGRAYRLGSTHFQCLVLSVHPTRGGARAIGWLIHPAYETRIVDLDAVDFTGRAWQEIEGGEPQC
jgi:hypothetical protein